MAITVTTVQNGERNLILNIHITNSVDYTAQQLFDLTTYDANAADVALVRCTALLYGFTATLLWDATTDVEFLQLPEGEDIVDYERFGGLQNTAGTGKTGDIMITTTGLAAGDVGILTLEFRKKF